MIYMKIIIKIVKRLVFALALLYSFNIIMNPVDLFIPINVYTIGTIAILAFPGLFLLVALKVI